MPPQGSNRRKSARPFALLRAKLDVPPPRPGLVERPRVVKRLGRDRGRRVVSVVAPPGYGKTTALGQWAAQDRRTFAWVSLDHRDNDPVLLLTYVAEALDAAEAVGPQVFKALAAGNSVWLSGLPLLGAAVASRREPFVLVLDDVHELENHECLDALRALLAHVPHGSQVALSGRSEAQVGLPRIRADGRLVEIGPSVLALTDGEAHALLDAAGADLTEEETRALNAHAEGWPAGLYLAALSLDSGGVSPASFGGEDRFVTDYLRAEELERIDAGQLEFLLQSSVLERMSAPLCDAVLAREGSAAMLEQLERENLFVVPLDHQRRWFRYHHLFREMLQGELERREPELVPVLNGRAAAWCSANGQPELAIEHAAAAGDVDELASLVAAQALPYYRTGRVTTVERWLALLDDEAVLREQPAVAVPGAMVHALRGRAEEAERWALAVETSDHEGLMRDGSPFEGWAAMLRSFFCKHGIEQMRADAELAVSTLAVSSPWLGVAVLVQGMSELFSGDSERADVVLRQAADAAVAGGAVWAEVVAHSELALLALERGDLAAADAELALADALVSDKPPADYVVTAILQAATARVAIAHGQGARARNALIAAQRTRPVLTYALSWFAVHARLELAKAHLALSDPRGAVTIWREAGDVLNRRPALGTLVEDFRDVQSKLTTVADQASGWASTLTAAELRLLPLLTTHLTFREIAERLYVSRNTVKTQAISVYRKLDASSRSEAIQRATELGLVDAAPAAVGADFIRTG
jgi:LuxR family transcriptional regulator, maltose regulon positive regulatory protein